MTFGEHWPCASKTAEERAERTPKTRSQPKVGRWRPGPTCSFLSKFDSDVTIGIYWVNLNFDDDFIMKHHSGKQILHVLDQSSTACSS